MILQNLFAGNNFLIDIHLLLQDSHKKLVQGFSIAVVVVTLAIGIETLNKVDTRNFIVESAAAIFPAKAKLTIDQTLECFGTCNFEIIAILVVFDIHFVHVVFGIVLVLIEELTQQILFHEHVQQEHLCEGTMLRQFLSRQIRKLKLILVLSEVMVEEVLFTESRLIIDNLERIVDTVILKSKAVLGFENQGLISVRIRFKTMLGVTLFEAQHFASHIFVVRNEHNVFFLLGDFDSARIVAEEQSWVQRTTNFILLIIGQIVKEFRDSLIFPLVLNFLRFFNLLIKSDFSKHQEIFNNRFRATINQILVCKETIIVTSLFFLVFVIFRINNVSLLFKFRNHCFFIRMRVNDLINKFDQALTMRGFFLVFVCFEHEAIALAKEVIRFPTVTIANFLQLRQVNGRHIESCIAKLIAQINIIFLGLGSHLVDFIHQTNKMIFKLSNFAVFVIFTEFSQQVIFPNLNDVAFLRISIFMNFLIIGFQFLTLILFSFKKSITLSLFRRTLSRIRLLSKIIFSVSTILSKF